MSVWQLCFENTTLSERRNNSQQHIIQQFDRWESFVCRCKEKCLIISIYPDSFHFNTHTPNHAGTTFSQRRRNGPEVSGEARKWWGIFKTNKQKEKKKVIRLQIFAKKGETIAPFFYPHVSSK